MIKDSGNRTEFSSGAVRDMHTGKGRCDLMPLEVIADITDNSVIEYISKFQKHGNTDYLIEMLRERYDSRQMSDMLLKLAVHFEQGAEKYGEHNWQKGIPQECYIDSAIRHYLKFCRGDDDEPHEVAFFWNVVCLIWECDYHAD